MPRGQRGAGGGGPAGGPHPAQGGLLSRPAHLCDKPGMEFSWAGRVPASALHFRDLLPLLANMTISTCCRMAMSVRLLRRRL